MRSKSKAFKALAWLCAVMALSTCTYDICLAQEIEGETPSDTIDRPGLSVEPIWPADPLILDTPADSLGAEDAADIRPLYKKWWVWALVTTAIAVTAVLAGGGEEKKTEEDLPGFPEPPNR